jgi:hypothetical protein
LHVLNKRSDAKGKNNYFIKENSIWERDRRMGAPSETMDVFTINTIKIYRKSAKTLSGKK